MKKKWIALMITVMATCFAFAACDLSALLGGQSEEASSSIEQEVSSIESKEEETSSSMKEESSETTSEEISDTTSEETSDTTSEEASEETSEEDSLNGGRLEGDNDLVWGQAQN